MVEWICVLVFVQLVASCHFSISGRSRDADDTEEKAAATTHQDITPASDENGVVTGRFSASSTASQSLSASTSSAAAGTRFTLPPGALSVDGDLTIQDGAQIIGNAADLDLGQDATSAGTPVVLKSTAPIKANASLAIEIPLDSQALLQDNHDFLVILYMVGSGGAFKLGVLPRAQLTVENGTIKFSFSHSEEFLEFTAQPAIVSVVPTEAKVIDTEKEIKTKTESLDETAAQLGAFEIHTVPALNSTNSLSISWDASENAESYDLVIASNESCSSVVTSQTGISATTQAISGLADGSYYVCVTARNSSGQSLAAEAMGFTVDTTAPAAPSITSTSPSSPSGALSISVIGSAEAGSTIAVYDNSSCSGTSLASGSAADFSSTGIGVTVSGGTTSDLFATATDLAGNKSACSTDGQKYSVPRLLMDINPGSANGVGIFGLYPAAIGSTMYFRGDDGVGGFELWKTDGTNTSRVKDINSGSASSYPKYMTPLGGSVFFVAETSASGNEPWISDGTDAGTVMLKDINTGAPASNPGQVTRIGSTVFFAATGANGYELWKSDGTPTGTVEVKDIRAGGSSNPAYFREMGGILYFTADDGTAGTELWKSDGTLGGTVLVKDIYPGATSASIFQIGTLNDNLLLFGANGDNGKGVELWKSTGAVSDGSMVLDINVGGTGSNPGGFIEMNGFVYFTADPGTGTELWRSDGTAGNTTEVGVVSGFYEKIIHNNKIYFSGHNGDNDYELWVTDGTTVNEVKDINPGAGSFPKEFVSVGDFFYFLADDGTENLELWKSDGTAAGTVMVHPISVITGACTSEFGVVGDKIYYYVDNGTHGVELYTFDL